MEHEAYIKEIEAKAAALKAWLKAPTKDEHIYVVGRDGLWLSGVEVINQRLTGKHTITGNALEAKTFSINNAGIIARATKNGNGLFEVQTKLAAVKECLEDAEGVLALFEFAESEL